VVKDLFFVARIRETARLAEVPLRLARSPEEVETAGVSVLAFTTHALARQTQPWHRAARGWSPRRR
jgi:hypothetical protein